MANPKHRVAERNLIFAGLGMTLGILSRDKVIRAFTDWLFDKSKPLGDILLAQKAITPEQLALINANVDAQIASEGGEEQALASLKNAKDLESDLDHLQDSDIHQTMAGVRHTKISSADFDATATRIPANEPNDSQIPIGRFRRRHFLDAGALGEVWIAEDTELNRTVVLKYIQERMADDPLSRALFHLEGEVTGYLEHPNIAPVYALGKDPLDRSYYAMRYIHGRKLTRAIAEYHAIPPKESGKRQETLIGLLQSFQAACMAVEYAHSRGVIHCDIKPDNIMVGAFGETMVVDWGLVLVRGTHHFAADKAAETLVAGEDGNAVGAYRPSSSASGGLHENQGGMRNYVGGTPAYIAPEQWHACNGGPVEVVTGACDVFSLGATLYQILTGHAPLLPDKDKGESREDYYKRVETANFPKPRFLRSDVPKPLEGVVLKAMSANPSDRYSSARELADELKRFVSDEPVVGYREDLGERSRRWMRNNRTAVGVTAMLLICTTVAGLCYAALVQGYNQKLTISETEAKANEKHAREQEAEARKQARITKERLYVSDIQRVQQDWEKGHLIDAIARLNSISFAQRGWEHDYLATLTSQNQATLNGHSGQVTSANFSPDGKRVVSASVDSTIMIWDAANGAEIITLRGHTEPVNGVSFSPDGKRIVSASSGGIVKIWDAANGAEIITLKGHTASVISASFSPDGKRILSASQDKIRLWDATTGAEITRIDGDIDIVNSVSFSPDGKRVVSANGEGSLKIWDAANGKEIISLKGDSPQYIASFSPDGKRVVSASGENTLKIWDAANGAEIITLRGHTGTVKSASFSPDGKCVISASDDATIRIWDAAVGSEMIRLKGHASVVSSAAFGPDGKRVVSASYDGTVKVWNASTSLEGHTLKGHGEYFTASFSPDGKRIVSASWNSSVKIWDEASGREIIAYKGHTNKIFSASFSPDGTRVVSGCYDGTVKIWDASTGFEILTLMGHTSMVLNASFSPDGKRVVSASHDGTVKIWDASSGEVIITLKGNNGLRCASFSPDGRRIVTASWDDDAVKVWDASTGEAIITLKGDIRLVNDASFSPDGSHIIFTNVDKKVKLFDGWTGVQIITFSGHTGPVNGASFSPDGKRIVSSSSDGTVKLWDPATRGEIITLEGDTSGLTCASFSPDGKRIVSASGNGTVRFWDATTRTEIMTLEGHDGPIYGATFNPDGKQIACIGFDNTVKIRNVSDGAEIRTLKGHSGQVYSSSFSPDGKRVVSASEDKTLKLWNASTGTEVITLKGHSDAVLNAGFSPEGARIASEDRSGTKKLWDVETGNEISPGPGEIETILGRTNAPTTADGLWSFANDIDRVILVNNPLRQARIARDRARLAAWAKPDPKWHNEQATESEKAGQWFAAVFHLKKLVEIEPNNADAKARLQAAEAKLQATPAAK